MALNGPYIKTADRATFFRYRVDSLAAEYGMIAFMPKPFTDNTGNCFHYTMSLWDKDTDEDLFVDENDPRGLDLSELGYKFSVGILNHARRYMVMVAPTVNSYKRLKAGTDQTVPRFYRRTGSWNGRYKPQAESRRAK